MALNTAAIMQTVVPLMQTLIYIFIAVGIAALFIWYQVNKRRRKWLVDIWEKKADGNIYLVNQDTLLEKRFNKGKQVAYWLKNARRETVPPPVECIHRYRGKEYASYLRILEDYIPLKQDIRVPDKHMFKRAMVNIIGEKSEHKVADKWIYAPLNKMIVGTLTFEPIPYDVDVMRINALDNRDKIYKDRQDWLTQYGTYIALGIIVVLIIVVLYLSYDYSNNVLTQAFETARGVTGPLQQIADNLGAGTPVG